MKFSDYVSKINKMLEENPECKNFDVICSTDDEGNSYRKVYFGPSIGYFDGRYTFYSENEDFENDENNAICVN